MAGINNRGGGIHVVGGPSLVPSLVNVVVEGCEAAKGGGIAVMNGAESYLFNAVVQNNTAQGALL